MTDELIRKSDALAALDWGDIYGRNAQAAIAALPAVTVGEDVAKAAIDRAIERLRALPNHAGRPAWDAIVAEEVLAALEPVAAPDLSDPVTVHANMLRGTIAKPTVEQIVHLYGRDAFQPMIDAAVAKALEEACLAVSEDADWPEDEHGRTEQVGLFARVINAIRAITPADTPADTPATDPACDHCGMDPAAIREAAIREAADHFSGLAVLRKMWSAADVENTFLALIQKGPSK